MMTAAAMTQKSDQSTIYGSSSSAGGSVGNSCKWSGDVGTQAATASRNTATAI